MSLHCPDLRRWSGMMCGGGEGLKGPCVRGSRAGLVVGRARATAGERKTGTALPPEEGPLKVFFSAHHGRRPHC